MEDMELHSILEEKLTECWAAYDGIRPVISVGSRPDAGWRTVPGRHGMKI